MTQLNVHLARPCVARALRAPEPVHRHLADDADHTLNQHVGRLPAFPTWHSQQMLNSMLRSIISRRDFLGFELIWESFCSNGFLAVTRHST